MEGQAAEKKTTLGALGAKLPTGGASRDMVAKPWRMKEEKEIGAMRQRMDKAGPGEFTAAVVGAMFTSLAGFNFEKMKETERLVHICKMSMGDVFYAYVWLRVQALGHEIDAKLPCPACAFVNVEKLSLLDLDVIEGVPGKQWTYKLVDPMEIRGQKVTTLTFGYPTWDVVRQSAGKPNFQLAKANTLRGAIRKVDDKEMLLGPNDLDEMTKRDIEGAIEAVSEHNAGPDFAIETTCKGCGTQIRTAIDWGFDGFFSKTTSGR